jgi:hypothetical protein
MAFPSFTSNSITFEPRSPGKYVDSTIALNAPTREIRFSPVGNPDKNGYRSMTATYVLEKINATSGVREDLVINIPVRWVGTQFSETDIDLGVAILSDILTAAVIKRLAQGES